MPNNSSSSFQLKPTPQTTDTYSPEFQCPRPNYDESPVSIRHSGWEDGRRYKSRSGIYVRSKTEKIVTRKSIERLEALSTPEKN